MLDIITLLHLFLVIVAITFAITFTITTIYIAIHHHTPSKHHFTGTVEMRTSKETLTENITKQSGIDSESAIREWQRKNGTDQF